MIDTPMKNIGEDVNRDILQSFYRVLYDTAVSKLQRTQIILIDKEFFQPTEGQPQIVSRYMTPEDEDAPPLISYYRGP